MPKERCGCLPPDGSSLPESCCRLDGSWRESAWLSCRTEGLRLENADDSHGEEDLQLEEDGVRIALGLVGVEKRLLAGGRREITSSEYEYDGDGIWSGEVSVDQSHQTANKNL